MFLSHKTNKNVNQIIEGNCILKSKALSKNNKTTNNEDTVDHATRNSRIFVVNK